MLPAMSIVELRDRGEGAVAVVYRKGRRWKGLRLLDGTIGEVPTPDQRCEAPVALEPVVGIGGDGMPAGLHHEYLGLVRRHASLAGVFVIGRGEVAAVYGARVEPIGSV
jgi:hypothetical protein